MVTFLPEWTHLCTSSCQTQPQHIAGQPGSQVIKLFPSPKFSATAMALYVSNFSPLGLDFLICKVALIRYQQQWRPYWAFPTDKTTTVAPDANQDRRSPIFSSPIARATMSRPF